MAKRRARTVLALASPLPEEDTRITGPLMNDRHPWSGRMRDDALKGADIVCHDVMASRGAASEPRKIKTVSSWMAHSDAEEVYRKKAQGE